MQIKFNEVNFSYDKKKKNNLGEAAIKDINLSIDSCGEFVSILGHTGSGKTTLIQHMNALMIPTSGFIEIIGSRVTPKVSRNPKLKSIRKKIGFVFQFPEYQLFEETVLKDIMFGPLNFGFSNDEAKENSLKYAKLLGIESILEKSPFELSGGQMRKVAIAGVLAYEPDVILLDEPTRGLDPISGNEIMEFFSNINKEFNKTIIMISHDMDIAYKYSTRMVVLSNGSIVYDGTKESLFNSDIYKEYHLRKPLVLESVDLLRKELGYKLTGDIYDLDSLIESLRGDGNE